MNLISCRPAESNRFGLQTERATLTTWLDTIHQLLPRPHPAGFFSFSNISIFIIIIIMIMTNGDNRLRSGLRMKKVLFDLPLCPVSPAPDGNQSAPSNDVACDTQPGKSSDEQPRGLARASTDELLHHYIQRCQPLDLQPPRNRKCAMALEIAAKERLWVLAAKDGSLFCIECPCDKILDPETPKGLARDRIVTRHFHTHSFEGGEAVAHFQDTHDEGSELDEQTVVQNYGRK